MRITQFYHNNRVHLGLIKDESIFPVDFPGEMIDFIKGQYTTDSSGAPISLEKVRFAPVVTAPSKIIGIGLNYQDHIQESKGKVPETPLVFAKFPNSLLGHEGQIILNNRLTGKVDYEAELAVIIGKRIFDCPESEVMKAVFGYTCANDVSARDLQFGDKQWVRGKSLDTFCPLGPWIVTTDEIPDPQSLNIRCFLNGRVMQESNTGLMIFKLPQLISFLSKNFTLVPGDVILTGTPHGVGAFRDPSIYLKDGDEIIIEIEKIGRLVNTCRTL